MKTTVTRRPAAGEAERLPVGDGSHRAAGAELRGTTRLALPVIAVQLGIMLMSTVDTAMLGRFSAEALAAGAIAHVISITLLIFGAGTLSALDPLVSQAFGAGDHRAVGGHLQRGLILAAVLAVPLSLLMIDVGPLLRALGEPAGVAAGATLYIRWLILGNLPFLLFHVLRQTLQAMSIVRPTLYAIAAANLVNGLTNYALIFGHWGCPRLGAPGSACATAAARWMMFLLLLLAARRPLRGKLDAVASRQALAAAWRGSGAWQGLARMLRIGLPIGLHLSVELSMFVAVALLMGHFGTASIAGHQVAIMLCALSFMVPVGIGGAATTRVGNAIGRGDLPAARLTAAVCLGLGAGVMGLFSAAFALAPRHLAALFTPDPEVIGAAARLLPIAAVFQVFDGTQVVGAGILRGAADTVLPAAGALVGYGLLGLPIGCLLAFRGGLGPPGLWWGVTLGLGVVATLNLARIGYRFRGPIARVG